MGPGKSPRLKLVGATVTVTPHEQTPAYFTPLHKEWIGKDGRVHAVLAGERRDDPLVKVGFADGTRIVFFRLADLTVHADEPLANPPRHGKRGSHLP
ncbi:MAG TPA: hypothetical protein VKR99_00955 [Candidatus Eremiobacteraceae bacterium]|nr:hypothetical protein [Candidatus Eremiobacteraceae bacterium]